MLRQRQRKTIEELYGKYEAPKSQVTKAIHPNSAAQKTGRITERDCGYMISSSAPYNGPAAPTSINKTSVSTKPLNTSRDTSRRKSARHSNKLPIDDDRCSPMQTSKGEKVSFIPPVNTNFYDNKIYGNHKDLPANSVPTHHHHNQHHHNHRHNGHDEEKNYDDTDEFFELIRRTVENAIGKSISELLNRNFRELCSKVERFSTDLKNSNALLSQMQNELNNKIVHYGEENSSHFRHLCLKSEYDKMFYQHQALISATAPLNTITTPSETQGPEKRKSIPKLSSSTPKMQHSEGAKSNATAFCPCRTGKCKTPIGEIKEPNKTSSEDISQKSSAMSMREVIKQMQKFCNQIQLNNVKFDQSSEDAGTTQKHNVMCTEDMTEINQDIFLDDYEDNDYEISSDEMTPRIESKGSPQYEGTTARGCVTQRGSNGAGDG